MSEGAEESGVGALVLELLAHGPATTARDITQPTPIANFLAQMELGLLQKTGPSRSAKTPRLQVLQDQLKRFEEQYRIEAAFVEDLQDYIKARAKLESDHAQNLHKLNSQYLAKKKWGDMTYTEGQSQILLHDLNRLVIALTSDASLHAATAEAIANSVSSRFDHYRDDKKAVFKAAANIITNLQEELVQLDASVAQFKKQYEVSMKELATYKKKAQKKQIESETKRLTQRAQRHKAEYLLEVAAANEFYMRYRNAQIPEVIDAVKKQDVEFLSSLITFITTQFGIVGQQIIDNRAKLQQLLTFATPEFERRAFLHEYRNEYPGRQLFDFDHYKHDLEPSRDLSNGPDSLPTLTSLRTMFEQDLKTIEEELLQKLENLSGLQKLNSQYDKAGDIFEKSQGAAIQDKVDAAYADFEKLLMRKSHITSKLARIALVLSGGVKQAAESLDSSLTTERARPSASHSHAASKDSGSDLSDSDEDIEPPASTVSLSPMAASTVTASPIMPPSVPPPALPVPLGSVRSTPTSSSGLAPPLIAPPTLPSPSLPPSTPAISETTASGLPAGVALGRGGPQALRTPTQESQSPTSRKPSSFAEELLSKATELGRPKGGLAPPSVAPPVQPDEDSGLPPPPDDDISHRPSTTSYADIDLPAPPPLEVVDVYDREMPVHYVVLYDYEATQPDDLTLVEGSSLLLLLERSDGWSQGINAQGQLGFFPHSYVRPLEHGEHTTMPSARLIKINCSSQVGFTLSASSPPIVKSITRSSEGYSAGLREGDAVLEVNSHSVWGMTEAEIWDMIRASTGLLLTLCVVAVS
eukprot:m.385937 g.385937  ORF g.385937 m.385937 type:complete len:811 (+) comp56294_c0_seq5:255-2687(+)